MFSDQSILHLYDNVLYKDKIFYDIPDEDIKSAIEVMQAVYKPSTCSLDYVRSSVADYNNPSHRCAYLHKYAALHTAMVRDMLHTAIRHNFGFFYNIVSSIYKFNVCCLGGGPGTDLIGVLAALHDAFCYFEVSATIVDYMVNWRLSFESIIRELGTGHFGAFGNDTYHFLEWRYLGANLLKSLSPDVHYAVASATLVTMIKFTSAASCIDTENMINNIFTAMRPGAILFFIDNDGGGYHQLIMQAASVHKFNSIYGPIRHENYVKHAVKVKKFGYKSCFQTTISVHVLQKPPDCDFRSHPSSGSSISSYPYNVTKSPFINNNQPNLHSQLMPHIFQPNSDLSNINLTSDQLVPYANNFTTSPDDLSNINLTNDQLVPYANNFTTSPAEKVTQSPRLIQLQSCVATPTTRDINSPDIENLQHQVCTPVACTKESKKKIHVCKKVNQFHIRGENYVKRTVKVKKFGYKSCFKPTITVHILQKPPDYDFRSHTSSGSSVSSYPYNVTKSPFINNNQPNLHSPLTPHVFQPNSDLSNINFTSDQLVPYANRFITSPVEKVTQSPRLIQLQSCVATPTTRDINSPDVENLQHQVCTPVARTKKRKKRIRGCKKINQFHIRGENYAKRPENVKKFGYKSCFKTTTAVHALEKPPDYDFRSHPSSGSSVSSNPYNVTKRPFINNNQPNLHSPLTPHVFQPNSDLSNINFTSDQLVPYANNFITSPGEKVTQSPRLIQLQSCVATSTTRDIISPDVENLQHQVCTPVARTKKRKKRIRGCKKINQFHIRGENYAKRAENVKKFGYKSCFKTTTAVHALEKPPDYDFRSHPSSGSSVSSNPYNVTKRPFINNNQPNLHSPLTPHVFQPNSDLSNINFTSDQLVPYANNFITSPGEKVTQSPRLIQLQSCVATSTTRDIISPDVENLQHQVCTPVARTKKRKKRIRGCKKINQFHIRGENYAKRAENVKKFGYKSCFKTTTAVHALEKPPDYDFRSHTSSGSSVSSTKRPFINNNQPNLHSPLMPHVFQPNSDLSNINFTSDELVPYSNNFITSPVEKITQSPHLIQLQSCVSTPTARDINSPVVENLQHQVCTPVTHTKRSNNKRRDCLPVRHWRNNVCKKINHIKAKASSLLGHKSTIKNNHPVFRL